MGLEHFSAPYEADAQMAYMVREGLADFAITEDSDLIAFGCPKILAKINHAGFGQLFDLIAFRA
jgi:exonuclease-1